jgi:hypothetical protein
MPKQVMECRQRAAWRSGLSSNDREERGGAEGEATGFEPWTVGTAVERSNWAANGGGGRAAALDAVLSDQWKTRELVMGQGCRLTSVDRTGLNVYPLIGFGRSSSLDGWDRCRRGIKALLAIFFFFLKSGSREPWQRLVSI